MKSYKRVLFIVFVAFIMVGSTTLSLNMTSLFDNSLLQPAKPLSSCVSSPESGIIPNGDFEDPRGSGSGATAYPYGSSAENHGGSVDSRNIASDSYLHSRCWEMSTGSGGGWKNIWYNFEGNGAPNYCAFAVKIVQGQNEHDIIQVKIKDLTQSVGKDVELIYEYSHDTEQVMPSNTYQKVIHTYVDYGAWCYGIKDWKADWNGKYGYQPNMNNKWALLLALSTYGVTGTMVARFDAIWFDNSVTLTYPDNMAANGEFENPGSGSGATWAPPSWNHGDQRGCTNAYVASGDKYLHFYSFGAVLGTTSNGFKFIYQQMTNPAKYIAFGLKLVSGSSNRCIAQVSIRDMTANPNKELFYEFGTGQQVRQDGTWDTWLVRVIHEQISQGAWYYRIKDWKTDWWLKWGEDPSNSHTWRINLVLDNFDSQAAMEARFDAIWMVNDAINDVVYNGDFENTNAGSGSGPTWAPLGWTHGGQIGCIGTYITAGDSYLHYYSFGEILGTASNGYKRIYQEMTSPPNNLAFAVKVVDCSSYKDVAEVSIRDTTVIPNMELCYEFGTGQPARSNGSQGGWDAKVHHETVSLNTWIYRIRDWKSQWKADWGKEPDSSHKWRIILAVDNFDSQAAMEARFDAIWMDSSVAPIYGEIVKNGEFEDPGSGSGPTWAPPGWTHGGQTGCSNAYVNSGDKYLHYNSFYASLGTASNGFKYIYQEMTNPGRFVAFAVNLVSRSSDKDVVEVSIRDTTANPKKELFYEFGTGQQMRQDGSWSGWLVRVIHEQVATGTWYYGVKDWKSDWERKWGETPDNSHTWRINLVLDNFDSQAAMEARFDAILLQSGDRGRPENIRPVNVYVLDIATSLGESVSNEFDAYQGVLSAVDDAKTNTILELKGETLNVYYITSMADLAYLVRNPSSFVHCVFINTHGGVLPIPNDYVTYSGTNYIPNWQCWIGNISKNCRESGWIWVNIAGYPFSYVSNTYYWSTKQFIGAQGLNKYLGKDILCSTYQAASSIRMFEFDKTKFRDTYTGIPQNLYASVAEAKFVLPEESIGYVEQVSGTDQRVTFSILMNRSILGQRTFAGIYVQSGLALDANGNGVDSTDDMLKGYVATAMAIEETRKLTAQPTVKYKYYHGGPWDSTFGPHDASFIVTMDPYGYGDDHDMRGDYYYVDLKFFVGAYFDKRHWELYLNRGVRIWNFLLNLADLNLQSDNEKVYFDIAADRWAVDTGNTQDPAFMFSEWLFWGVGLGVGFLGEVGIVLGPAIGLIPLLLHPTPPPDLNIYDGADGSGANYNAWIRGVQTDQNTDNKGTACSIVRLKFYGNVLPGHDAVYSFTANMVSWIQYDDGHGNANYRWAGISHTIQLSFIVHNWSP